MSTYRNVKLCRAHVATRVRGLHNHLLPRNGTARERKRIALAASRVVGADGSESIGQLVVHGPWALVAAHVG